MKSETTATERAPKQLRFAETTEVFEIPSRNMEEATTETPNQDLQRYTKALNTQDRRLRRSVSLPNLSTAALAEKGILGFETMGKAMRRDIGFVPVTQEQVQSVSKSMRR